MIKVFIIEDHKSLVVNSFKYMFHSSRDGIKVEGSSETVDGAKKIADPERIDVFILDLYLPKTFPIDNFRDLKQHFPTKPIVIFTSESSPYWRTQMLEAGAISYLTKDATREELKLTLQRAVKGETVFLGEKKTNVQIRTSNNTPPEMIDLSPLQREILKLLADGLNHKQIAQKVSLSRSRVEQILKEIRESLHVQNNVNLISILLRSNSI